MKRTGYEVDDIQSIMVTLLKAKVTGGSPWSAWDVIRGWPDAEVFEILTKPFIYVMNPFLIRETPSQGGIKGAVWEMVVGGWTTSTIGGSEENQIIASKLLAFYRDGGDCHRTTFTISLGGTAYTSLTLIDHGLFVMRASGPRMIRQDGIVDGITDYRNEILLTLRT